MASCLARRLGKDTLRAPLSGGGFRVRVLVFREVAVMDSEELWRDEDIRAWGEAGVNRVLRVGWLPLASALWRGLTRIHGEQ